MTGNSRRSIDKRTNVNNTESINTVLELLRRHHDEIHTFGLTEENIQGRNVFHSNRLFYTQERGLAMSLRIAPLLAIAYLDRIQVRSLMANGR